MWRLLIATALTAVVLTAIAASAALLTVQPAQLTVFTYPVELEPVPATISKELIEVNDADGDGAGVVEVGERVEFTLSIAVKNVSTHLTGVVVSDAFGAELEIVETEPSVGTASISTIGGSDKPFLTWDIGTLDPDQEETLKVVAATDVNPGGHQEYTEAGDYELNSGATLKALSDGKQFSATSEVIWIWVEVVEANAGESEDSNPTLSSTPTTPTTGEYQVQPGDTLIDIAAGFGTTVEAVVQLNSLEDPDVILYGSTLNVPYVGEDAGGATADVSR